MINIGLTGNRYSGKDKIASQFEKISIPVFNADVVLKFIIQYDTEVDKKIKIELGSSIFSKNGSIDIDKIGTDIAFNRLIDIAENDLFDAYKRFQNKNSHSIYTIFHSSILFERGWDKKMDFTISVFTPKSERINRAQKEEPNISQSTLWRLASSEIDEIEKNKKSNYVIHNYTGAIDLIKQVDSIDQQIIDNYLKNETTTKKSKKNIVL